MSLTIVTEIDQLVEQVHSYAPEADEAVIRRAYDFSAKAHEGQTRRSGEPYLQHPLAVAGILTFLKLDETAIVAALLHDTL
ncbi:MAG: HD domain-containing protein, partial [Nitrospirales bacterium]